VAAYLFVAAVPTGPAGHSPGCSCVQWKHGRGGRGGRCGLGRIRPLAGHDRPQLNRRLTQLATLAQVGRVTVGAAGDRVLLSTPARRRPGASRGADRPGGRDRIGGTAGAARTQVCSGRVTALAAQAPSAAGDRSASWPLAAPRNAADRAVARLADNSVAAPANVVTPAAALDRPSTRRAGAIAARQHLCPRIAAGPRPGTTPPSRNAGVDRRVGQPDEHSWAVDRRADKRSGCAQIGVEPAQGPPAPPIDNRTVIAAETSRSGTAASRRPVIRSRTASRLQCHVA
jgi:hypothetical protein